jgi:type VI secretion system protein ImpF
MAKTPGSRDPLTPSLLDRLTDAEPATGSSGSHRFQVLSELRQSVRRDLENLLNSRWRCTSQEAVATGLQDSLVNYGLPDFSGGSSEAAQDHDIVYRAIADAIARFEPRLTNVQVRPARGEQTNDRTLRFHIEAVLRVEPWQEAVRFNTMLEPTTGHVTVKANEKS